ncbi:MAG TPA: pyrimidine dimer DNA glycosylase/endonuclease V [Vicinamibacteria bacterium]|nr:pyrimidine dimer DNA glycosylase/endonuclease V [Vicinamibacteria bacterium]
MRIWTLHPKYLDARGLVALWRESLLARAVLAGRTRGYRAHPQLLRFRAAADPIAAINLYLAGVAEEAARRGYRFDRGKLPRRCGHPRLAETRGQLQAEWRHLRAKLRRRAPALARKWRTLATPMAHPLFRVVRGRVRSWEKARA